MIQILHAAFVYQSPDGEVEALRDVSFDVREGILQHRGSLRLRKIHPAVGAGGTGTTFRRQSGVGWGAGVRALPEGGVHAPAGSAVRVAQHLGQRDAGPDGTGENTPQRQAHVRELLERYGLADFAQKRPSQLSGGMRQRCALIRTLAAQPKVLLLDEPFSALDYQTRLAVSADIYRIIRQEGKTALLVTHDISEAISLSDRVVVLSHRPAVVKSIHRLTQLQGVPPLQRQDHPAFAGYFKSIWKELEVHEG